MTKKFELSDEERALFRDAVKKIKIYHTPQAVEKITIRTTTERKLSGDTPKQVGSDDVIAFSRAGLQHKKFTQLKQGKYPIEASLDLHHHTQEEALDATDAFLSRCQQRDLKVVCIIHGKGLYSAAQTPILKNCLNHYLRSHPAVLAFSSAKSKHGGTGAVIVLLRRS